MAVERIKFILITLTLLVLHSNNAYALDDVYFHPAKNAKELYIIDKITKKLKLPPEQVLAPADLNNDLIDEYFMRPAECKDQQRCLITIIALRKDTPIILGQLESVRIIVSDTHNYGVRDLMVAETRTNDFQETKYQWNPHHSLYEKAPKK